MLTCTVLCVCEGGRGFGAVRRECAGVPCASMEDGIPTSPQHPPPLLPGGPSDIFILRTTPNQASQGRLISEAARLDARWTLFGYITEGITVATSLSDGDVIESAKVVSGLEHFQKPSFSLMDMFFPPDG